VLLNHAFSALVKCPFHAGFLIWILSTLFSMPIAVGKKRPRRRTRAKSTEVLGGSSSYPIRKRCARDVARMISQEAGLGELPLHNPSSMVCASVGGPKRGRVNNLVAVWARQGQRGAFAEAKSGPGRDGPGPSIVRHAGKTANLVCRPRGVEHLP
jgi:hypothetical protein